MYCAAEAEITNMKDNLKSKVTENEEIEILVNECDEEGWVMTRNSVGEKGYVPINHVEIVEKLGLQSALEKTKE